MNNIFKKTKGSGGKFLCCLLSMMLVITVVPISQTFPFALSGPEVSDNIHSSEYDYKSWKTNDMSFLQKTPSGYERLEALYSMELYTGDSDGSGYQKCNSIVVEQYDSNFQFRSKKTLDLDSDVFGGVYYGSDYNYVVTGDVSTKQNYEQNKNFCIHVYTKSWELLNTAFVTGWTTAIPFWGGSCSITEDPDYVYVHTCSKGLDGHQRAQYFMYSKNEKRIVPFAEKPFNFVAPASHSYRQNLVRSQNGNLYAVGHGDASPRSIYVYTYVGKNAYTCDLHTIPLKTYAKQLTGVQLGGSVVTDKQLMVAYADNEQGTEWADSNFNIFVKMLPTNAKTYYSNGSIETSGIQSIQLTNYDDNSKVTAECPKIIQLSDGNVVVMWEEWTYAESQYISDGTFPQYRLDQLERSLGTNKVAYVILDSDGKVIQGKQTIDAALSDCEPIEADSKLVWYVTHNSAPTFYTLAPYVKSVESDGCKETDWSDPKDVNYIPQEYYEKGSDEYFKYAKEHAGGKSDSSESSSEDTTSSSSEPNPSTTEKTTQAPVKPDTGTTWTVTETPGSYDHANNEVTANGVTYRIQGSEAAVTGYTGNATSVVVYDSIQKGAYTYPVTMIADNAFASASTVKTLYIPVTLSSIGSMPSTVKVYLNADTMISKVSGKRKSMQLKWVKRTGIDGYQIQYGTNKKFKSAKKVSVKVKTKNPTSKTIKKLKLGKKYYARIRLYKTISGRKYYSAWSGKRTVKIK